MFKQTKGFITGFICCAILMGTLGFVFAAPIEKTITALYDNIKIYVDGVLIQPKDANGNDVEPFIYEGTTYLPVRAVGEAFGKNVDWDGISKSVYVGKRTDTEQYLGEHLKAYQMQDMDEYAIQEGESFSMNGVKYYRGLVKPVTYWGHWDGPDNWALYNLNSQYSIVSGMLGHVDGTDMNNPKLPKIYLPYCRSLPK